MNTATDTKKKRGPNILWLITAVMLVAVGFEYFLIGAGQPSERSARQIIEDFDKKTPSLINDETQLARVIKVDNSILFNYILLKTRYSDVDTLSFDEDKTKYAAYMVCKNPDLTSLLKKDLTVKHVYYDKFGKLVGTYEVTTWECDQLE